jgi:hypothetical protein
MAPDGRRTRPIPDSELRRILELTKGSDSVELKLTVPDSDIRSAVTSLGMDPLSAKIRQVFFFDTPDLRLDRAGVVVRARRLTSEQEDCVVKLRPVVPDELDPAVRKLKDLVVEVDAMPGGYVCSATLKSRPAAGSVLAATGGSKSLKSLLSKEQRAFYAAHAPEDVRLEDLAVMGPITLLKLKFAAEGLARRMVAELWFYPNASRILELSTKCGPAEMFQAAAESRAWLAERGVDLSGAQQTKTRAALTYFSRAMTADAASDGRAAAPAAAARVPARQG